MCAADRWVDLLERVNRSWLDCQRLHGVDGEFVPGGCDWLGAPGVDPAALIEVEHRLGAFLPPTYREFLAITDGWLRFGYFGGPLLRASAVGWFRDREPEALRAWSEGAELVGVDTPDERYFRYGPGQHPVDFRAAYLPDLLQVSEFGEVTYLLNPAVRDEDGEWEAWALSPAYPGAHRFRSFWDLACHAYETDHVLFPERHDDLLISASGLPHPAAFAHGCEMRVGQALRRQSLTSPSGTFTLVHQNDGDLVLYRYSDGYPVWTSGTAGIAAGSLQLGDDGDLVLYAACGLPVWSSGTAGQPVERLAVADVGELLLIDASGEARWRSGGDKRAPSGVRRGSDW